MLVDKTVVPIFTCYHPKQCWVCLPNGWYKVIQVAGVPAPSDEYSLIAPTAWTTDVANHKSDAW